MQNVIDPDGKHPLSLKEAASTQSFQVNHEGFYEIHRANGRVEMVAVHTDRLESDLTPVPQETLELWRNTGRGPDTPVSQDGSAAQNQPRPWSLWRYALLLVLITAIIESVFASRYLSVEKEVA